MKCSKYEVLVPGFEYFIKAHNKFAVFAADEWFVAVPLDPHFFSGADGVGTLEDLVLALLLVREGVFDEAFLVAALEEVATAQGELRVDHQRVVGSGSRHEGLLAGRAGCKQGCAGRTQQVLTGRTLEGIEHHTTALYA
jgi:hypothetical protein